MAVAATEARKVPTLRSVRTMGTLAFSGNYVAGGEVPSGFNKPGTTKDPYEVHIVGQGTHDYKYDRATGKIKVFLAGVEIAAAAYPAGVTGDTVRYEAEYPKLG